MDDFENPDTALGDLTWLSEEEPRFATIRKWSMVGDGRLMGGVFDHPRHQDGKVIMTSPVSMVRMMGRLQAPVAITVSGTAYWLGPPAPAFGVARARAFVKHKLLEGEAQSPPAEAAMRTTTMKTID